MTLIQIPVFQATLLIMKIHTRKIVKTEKIKVVKTLSTLTTVLLLQ